jgi:nonribosomal peptide synthetase CepB
MAQSRIEDFWPLSPLQEGLLFHTVYDDEGPGLYVGHWILDLDGPVEAPRLRSAWEALLARHAALRACFRQRKSGETVQLIARQVELPWRVVDLSHLDDPEQAVRELAEEDRTTRFDLANAPLLRLTLIRLADDSHRLVVTCHHAIMDGWSMPIIFDELSMLYAADGGPLDLPEVRSYREYLAWLDRQDKQRTLSAWAAELSGAEEPTLVAPADQGRAPAMPDNVMVEMPADLTRSVNELARAHGLTLNTGCVGVGARTAGRPDGRGVRGRGLGAAAGSARRRGDGGAVPQHRSGAGAAARVDAGHRTAGGVAEEAVGAHPRPVRGVGGHPEGDRPWRDLRHVARFPELSA